jgi:c-di-GMP-binding flagellar brake protein YcgR
MKTNDEIWATFERMQGEIAREIRVMLGEGQYDQRIFTAEERARRVEAMKLCAAQSTTDAERHESWMQMHIDQGWTWGPEFRPDIKQHPNLQPWDELPASTRTKAQIFDICARYAAAIVAE